MELQLRCAIGILILIDALCAYHIYIMLSNLSKRVFARHKEITGIYEEIRDLARATNKRDQQAIEDIAEYADGTIEDRKLIENSWDTVRGTLKGRVKGRG